MISYFGNLVELLLKIQYYKDKKDRKDNIKMTVKCAICGYEIKSLDIIQDKAVKEVSNNLSMHLIQCHKEKVAEIQKATSYTTQQLIWFMILTLAAKVPENEVYLTTQIEKARGELAAILGIEIVGTEEECEIVDVKPELEVKKG